MPGNKISLSSRVSNLTVIIQQRFKIVVHIYGIPDETKVEGAQKSQILVFLVFYEFDDDIALWLYLKHLQGQTKEVCNFACASIKATTRTKFHG